MILGASIGEHDSTQPASLPTWLGRASTPSRLPPNPWLDPAAAPEVPRREAAVGAPGLGKGAQLGGFREVGVSVVAAHGAAEAEVVHGQHVGAAQAEDKEHLIAIRSCCAGQTS